MGSRSGSRLVVLMAGASLACSGEPDCPVCETDAVETGDTDPGDTDTGDTDTGDTDTGTPETGDCEDFTTRRHAYFGDYTSTPATPSTPMVSETRAAVLRSLSLRQGLSRQPSAFDEDGVSERLPVQIRAADFTAVTDHPSSSASASVHHAGLEAYYDRECINFRNTNLIEENLSLDITFGTWGLGLTLDPPQRPSLCDDADCEAAQVDAWTVLRGLTDDANEPCAFTAFHGYEYTNQDSTSMLHRNVIFRTATVPERPISSIDARNWKELAAVFEAAATTSPTARRWPSPTIRTGVPGACSCPRSRTAARWMPSPPAACRDAAHRDDSDQAELRVSERLQLLRRARRRGVRLRAAKARCRRVRSSQPDRRLRVVSRLCANILKAGMEHRRPSE